MCEIETSLSCTTHWLLWLDNTLPCIQGGNWDNASFCSEKSPNTPDRPREGNISPASVKPQVWLQLSVTVTVCGRLRSLSNVPKPNWLWYWRQALPGQCLPVVSRCSSPAIKGGVEWMWPMRGRVCWLVVLWLLLCPMVIMRPDTTISDDRRVRHHQRWGATGGTGEQEKWSVMSLMRQSRMMKLQSRPSHHPEPPPAGKCSLDNTHTQTHTQTGLTSLAASPVTHASRRKYSTLTHSYWGGAESTSWSP